MMLDSILFHIYRKYRKNKDRSLFAFHYLLFEKHALFVVVDINRYTHQSRENV